MKRIFSTVAVIILLSISTLGVKASDGFEIPYGSAVFSLQELEVGGKLIYENSDLNYSIEVAKVVDGISPMVLQTFSLQNSTYTISYKSLTENISYKVVVSNNSFTQVHSGSYSVTGYFVESSSLRLVAPKYATYSFVNKLLLKQWTSSLESRINTSNELVISFN